MYLPECWCIGAIVPIHKKGSLNDPDNYRPITLLSCLGKIFTSIINARLNLYLECAGYIGDEQAGFRRSHSTSDHIFALHLIISIYKAKNKRLFAAFIDLKKAFDFVDRAILWRKVMAMNINGKILNVIKNMYSKAKSCVKNGGSISDTFTCHSGVRQGENLSPLLFSIFLNDMEQSLFGAREDGVYCGLGDLSNEMHNLSANGCCLIYIEGMML